MMVVPSAVPLTRPRHMRQVKEHGPEGMGLRPHCFPVPNQYPAAYPGAYALAPSSIKQGPSHSKLFLAAASVS